MAKDRETMSLEQYIQFFDSRKQLDLTMKLLNEIILMHGFKRIHKVHKKVLIDAIETIELMDPRRSTVQKHTFLPESMKLEEVIEDLKELTWQECCVTSMESLNSHRDLSLSLSHSQSASAKIAPQKAAKNKARKSVNAVYDKCLDGATSTSTESSSGTAEKPPLMKLPAKRTRTAAPPTRRTRAVDRYGF